MDFCHGHIAFECLHRFAHVALLPLLLQPSDVVPTLWQFPDGCQHTQRNASKAAGTLPLARGRV